MADTRTYIKLHDGIPEHPKILAAGGDAAWLHVCAIAYCSRNLTDGVFPDAVVPRLSDRKSPVKLRQKLVDLGLWHEPGHDCKSCVQPMTGSLVVHDYLEHQRSSAEVGELRRVRAAAGKKGGKSRASRQASAKQVLDRGLKQPGSKAQPVSEVVTDVTTQTETESESDTNASAASQRTAGPPRGELVLVEDPPGADAPGQAKGKPADELTKRAQTLAKTYKDLVPLSSFVSVMRIAKTAIQAGYDDDRIKAALLRLAADGRSVTTDTLRIEMEGRARPGGNGYRPFMNPTDPDAYRGTL